jgi:hypothetical protein
MNVNSLLQKYSLLIWVFPKYRDYFENISNEFHTFQYFMMLLSLIETAWVISSGSNLGEAVGQTQNIGFHKDGCTDCG